MKKIYLSLILSATALFIKANNALATAGDTEADVKLKLPQKDLPQAPQGLFANAFTFAFGAIIGVALLAVIISGIRYITSYGSPAYMEKAKNGLFYAILGLVFVILSYTIFATINLILTGQ
ncbi:hypothetical protein ACFL2D_01900 [Patescibacteria group bacterium]